MNSTTIVGVIIGLVIGAGGGYFIASGASSGNAADQKKLQDSVSMMKDQAASIKEMAAMMQSSGNALQTAGMQYKDDALVQQGKDLQAVAAKNTQSSEASSNNNGMGEIMK